MNDSNLVLDRYGRAIYSCDDLCEMLMNGTEISNITNVVWSEDAEKYNEAVKENYDGFSLLTPMEQINMSIDEYDTKNQNHWFVPAEYLEMDIVSHIMVLSPDNEISKKRIQEELFLYDKYQLLDVLKICLYLVDTAKENKLVLGVGRGSSVASYVLYLLGVHKIDSIKYNLDMAEFLR